MDPIIIGIAGCGVLIILLVIGVPIAYASALAGLAGSMVLSGFGPGLAMSSLVPYSQVARYTLTVLPLFTIMGFFAHYAGIPERAFEVGQKWFGHLRAGPPMAVIFANGVFAATSGASVATAAIFAKVSLPDLEKAGYNKAFSAALIASTGTFASLIPPSAMMVVYAVMVDVSVGKQLMAGILPGILTVITFTITVSIWLKLKPSMAGVPLPPTPWKQRIAALPQLRDAVILALIVIGGIYTGIFTSTESGAIGAFAAFIMMAVLMKKSARGTFWDKVGGALLESARITGFIFILIIGVMIFARFLALTQITYMLVDLIASLPVNRYVILIGILLFYIVLGTVFDASGMMVLTIPVVIPVMEALHFDLIWFGVVLVKMIEIALVSPPVGLTIFVVQAAAPHIPLGSMFRSVIPFNIADLVVVSALVIWPAIALVIPNAMK